MLRGLCSPAAKVDTASIAAPIALLPRPNLPAMVRSQESWCSKAPTVEATFCVWSYVYKLKAN